MRYTSSATRKTSQRKYYSSLGHGVVSHVSPPHGFSTVSWRSIRNASLFVANMPKVVAMAHTPHPQRVIAHRLHHGVPSIYHSALEVCRYWIHKFVVVRSHPQPWQPEANLCTLFGCFCLFKRIVGGGGSLRINVISPSVGDGLIQCCLALQSILRGLSALFLGLSLLKGVIDCGSRFGVCRPRVVSDHLPVRFTQQTQCCSPLVGAIVKRFINDIVFCSG